MKDVSENVEGDNCDVTETEADNGTGTEEVWTQEKLMRESRKFNIDIAPKVRLLYIIIYYISN